MKYAVSITSHLSTTYILKIESVITSVYREKNIPMIALQI